MAVVNQAINDLAANVGVRWFDYQREFLAAAVDMPGPAQRVCLYYKTGAGKTITSLAAVALWGHDQAVVVAPPSTHKSWEEWGQRFGIAVEAMSHAKFRMKGTKLSRKVPVIADEMHMFGGQKGQGWRKLDKLAMHLQAPMVLASATPNYNDAERVYCIQHVLDPASLKGGYLQFLYANCETEQNPFAQEPYVTGFLRFKDAAEYLASLPGVFYLPDDLTYSITDIGYDEVVSRPMETYGYDERNHRMIASQMEERHTRRYQGLVDEDGLINGEVYQILTELVGNADTPVLIYANHSTVAQALDRSLQDAKVRCATVTGNTSKIQKNVHIQRFKDGHYDVLVGTASLATGTDGLDKMCDWLIILDDTDDDSLRRQLIGRIMPRGADTDASRKQVYRLTPVPS